ncbi:MAG: HAD-IB family hydrolase [Acidobacteria bacterium]|nr:HAD-IB family hydrolase [Acidobacteriota bacterium]
MVHPAAAGGSRAGRGAAGGCPDGVRRLEAQAQFPDPGGNPAAAAMKGRPLAFFDFDGTLVSSNVVTQYAFFVRRLPGRARVWWKQGRMLVRAPAWLALEFWSRRRFNEAFFREYRGMREDWLRGLAEPLFEEVIRPAIYPGAAGLVAADRERGYRTVLVTGSLDVALEPVVRHFGFDEVISNTLLYDQGAATGRLAGPLIAGQEKVEAMAKLCREQGVGMEQARAYSDSFSDRGMLEAVGQPAAVNPDRRLRRLALERGWPVLALKEGRNGNARA